MVHKVGKFSSLRIGSLMNTEMAWSENLMNTEMAWSENCRNYHC